MTAINTLYELAEDYMQCIVDTYAQYTGNEDVKALPVEDNRFITIGSVGSFPQNTSDQLAVYIGAPFPGIAQQGDSTLCLTPTSVLFGVDLTRCYAQPDVKQQGGRIVNNRYRTDLAKSVKQQSNDMLLIRDASKAFYDMYGAGPGNSDSIQLAVGQDNSGAIVHLTVTVVVLTAKKSREINVRIP
jgi:hypothetical protein